MNEFDSLEVDVESLNPPTLELCRDILFKIKGAPASAPSILKRPAGSNFTPQVTLLDSNNPSRLTLYDGTGQLVVSLISLKLVDQRFLTMLSMHAVIITFKSSVATTLWTDARHQVCKIGPLRRSRT